MSYTEDIKRITSQMHEKSANEEIHRLMDALNGDEESLVYLLSFVKKWDQKCRDNYGLRTKVENYRKKHERLNYTINYR